MNPEHKASSLEAQHLPLKAILFFYRSNPLKNILRPPPPRIEKAESIIYCTSSIKDTGDGPPRTFVEREKDYFR